MKVRILAGGCFLSSLLFIGALNLLMPQVSSQWPGQISLTLPVSAQPSTVAQTNYLSQQALDKAQSVFDQVQVAHYEHNPVPARDQVRVVDGVCQGKNDCSGFVSYVLYTVSPKHYREVHQLEPDHDYPQAKVYTQFFRGLSSSNPQGGWLGVASLSDLRPGDLIAWQKGGDPNAKGNTGHVMFVAEPPRAIKSTVNKEGEKVRFASVRVIDSSSVRHFEPEELPPHASQSQRDGIGKGYVRIIVDDQDHPIGYWEGTYWGEGGKEIHHPTMTDEIGFARLIPFHEQ